MLIPLEILKVMQAAGVLLRVEPSHRLSRLRLLKYLYIADRESLQQRARPITGDNAVAMDHGPVLTTTYEMIKGSDFCSPEWDQYFGAEGRDVLLRKDPGLGKLTRYEIQKLQDVSHRFVDQDDYAVADYTHSFPEWLKNKPPKGSRRDIPVEDLLAATGLTAVKEQVLRDLRAESDAASQLR
jgi:hypothetical protein